MTAADRIAATQRILSGAAITPDSAVIAHALLAAAEAILETAPPNAPQATPNHAQPKPVPQDQPTPEWATPPYRCPSVMRPDLVLGRLPCERELGHPGPHRCTANWTGP